MKDKQSKILVFAKCVLIVLLLGSFMGGCASVPEKNEALDNARAAYEKAQADPDVKANAPVALYEAGQELKRAEQAREVEDINYFAYIAEKKAEIAMALAEGKKYEKDLERLSQEKDKIVLQAREQEVQRVKREADILAQQAEEARREAEARAVEIERARGKAEIKALEAEQARKEAETRALELEKARKEAEAKTLEAQMAKVQTEQAVEKRKELESELKELKAKRSERGIVLTLGDILFETGKANLMPGAMRTIDQLAEFLEKHSERNVLIEGHTDSVGTELYNLVLSQRRADAVKTALIARGISPDRIMTKGYGERYPVASNETSAGRQQNRRVEIIILEEGVSPGKALR